MKASTPDDGSDGSAIARGPRLAETRNALNKLLVAAAVLAAITALLHVTGGTSQYATPLPNSDLDEGVRFVLLAVWHMSSVAICLSAAGLAWAAARRQVLESRAMVLFVGLMWIGFGLCFFYVALTETGDSLFAKLIGPPILLIPPGTLAVSSQIHRVGSDRR